jgi:hypothetical protein
MSASNPSSRRWYVLGIVGGIVLGAAVAWAARGHGARQVAHEPAETQEVDQLRTEVQALRGQVGALALNAGAAAPAAVQPTTEPAAEVPNSRKPKERLTEDQIQQRELAHSRRVASYADAYLEREAQDPAWGGARETEIRTELKGLSVPGFSLRAADCRATICRVVIDRRPEGITQELGPALSELPAFRKMGAFYHYEEDKVVVYSPREGHPFPNDPELIAQAGKQQEGR